MNTPSEDNEERQFAEMMEAERLAELERDYLRSLADSNETPSTEQELFNQILNDERNE